MEWLPFAFLFATCLACRQLSSLSDLRRIADASALAALVLAATVTWVARLYRITSSSMEPTVPAGAVVLVDLRRPSPRRGQVLLCSTPRGTLIKRLVAVGGEHVSVIGGNVVVNGQSLHEPYASRLSGPGPELREQIVPPDALFLLGDNRGNSVDSRMLGSCRQDQVTGQACLILWPLRLFGTRL